MILSRGASGTIPGLFSFVSGPQDFPLPPFPRRLEEIHSAPKNGNMAILVKHRHITDRTPDIFSAWKLFHT